MWGVVREREQAAGAFSLAVCVYVCMYFSRSIEMMKMLFSQPKPSREGERVRERKKQKNFLSPAAPHRNFPISLMKCFYASAMYLFMLSFSSSLVWDSI